MGILFRNGSYVKYVRVGKRTIKDGEAAAIWDVNGQHREVVGPQLVRLWCSTIRFLDRKVAGPNEYLCVTHKNGQIEHICGPHAMFCNPVRHQSITVLPAIVLKSPKDCIVVYQKKKIEDVTDCIVINGSMSKNKRVDQLNIESKCTDETETAITTGRSNASKKDDVQRRIVKGPAIFVPKVEEWTHKFCWSPLISSSERKKKTRKPGEFEVLATGPRCIESSIKFRTADSVLLIAHLSIRFSVQDVTAVLEGSDDPIAAMLSTISADLAEFGTRMRSDDMLDPESRNKITVQLGTKEQYKKLLNGASLMGFEVIELCLHGLDCSSELQAQYDQSMLRKSQLAADRAAAEQKQHFVDMELANQKRRMESEQSLASAKLAHELKLQSEKSRQQLESNQKANEQVLQFLKELKGHDVDLTKFLTSFAGKKAMVNHLNKANVLKHIVAPEYDDGQ